jgi:glucose/arabinose dehydrogenase
MRRIRTWVVAVFVSCGVAADLHAQLRTRVYVTGLSVPVAYVQDPTDRDVKFIVQQDGRIRVFRGTSLLPTDFLNLASTIVTGGEQGLLGLAFPPDAAASRRFFVHFTDRGGNIVDSRFRRSNDPVVADPASRFDLRWGGPSGAAYIPHPFGNHNAGQLAFGPDGLLYIGQGDGGAGDDPGNRAQTPSELLGKMLRIDVAVGDDDRVGYRIPPDNPFVGTSTRPEIWAFGLRNPWRFNFDDPARGGTGALVIADVGQNAWEEVDYEPAGRGGRNYGWRNREGAHANVGSQPPAFLPLVDPIHEYNHTVGASITGGFVYRGTALGASFRGRYFFADFITARVWSMGLAIDPVTRDARVTDVTEHTAELGNVGSTSSFGIDADGELYLVGYATGRIVKIIGPAAAPAAPSGLRIIR